MYATEFNYYVKYICKEKARIINLLTAINAQTLKRITDNFNFKLGVGVPRAAIIKKFLKDTNFPDIVPISKKFQESPLTINNAIFNLPYTYAALCDLAFDYMPEDDHTNPPYIIVQSIGTLHYATKMLYDEDSKSYYPHFIGNPHWNKEEAVDDAKELSVSDSIVYRNGGSE